MISNGTLERLAMWMGPDRFAPLATIVMAIIGALVLVSLLRGPSKSK